MLQIFGSKDNPRGPNLKNARAVEMNFSGTRISFRAPSHSSTHWKPFPLIETCNIFDQSIYTTFADDYPTLFPQVNCFKNVWAFSGKPILEGTLADLACRVALIYADTRVLEGSLFDPQNFEKVILAQLGAGSRGRVMKLPDSSEKPRFSMPHDWKVDSIQGNFWISLKLYSLCSSASELHWYHPISDHHYIAFVFERHLYYKGISHTPRLEKLVNYKPVDTLAEQVMQSCQLTLSEDSLNCLNRVKSEGPVTHYSNNVEPIDYTKLAS